MKKKANVYNIREKEAKSNKTIKDIVQLMKKYNIKTGPTGYEPLSLTKSKDIMISDFKMMDPAGGKFLIRDSEIKIVFGNHYGLIGKNGSGKTTLLKLISKYEIYNFPKHIRMLLVEQDEPNDSEKVIESVLNADKMRMQIHNEVNRIEELSAQAPEEEVENFNILLTHLYDLMDTINYDQGEKKARQILSGLGFSLEESSKLVCDLSGGWKMRVALAKSIFVKPDLLLLDEPTNHLDFPTVLWLQQYLQKYENTIIVVSHDRTFLDKVSTHIIHLVDHRLKYYKGNYSTFDKVHKELIHKNWKDYEKWQLDMRHIGEFIDKFRHSGPKRQAQIQSKLKILQTLKENAIEEPIQKKLFLFSFPDVGKLKQQICIMKDVSFKYNSKKTILKNIFLSIDMDSKIGIMGSNGVGKTTLVKLIMGKLIPTTGELVRNRNARIALFTQHHIDQLNLELSAIEFISKLFGRSEHLLNEKNKIQTIRKKLGKFSISGKQQTEKMKYLSGGQKSRIALCIIVWERPHFLIMDEPTNHLDHETIDSLINAIIGAEKSKRFQGGTLLISHDQHFLTKVASEFWTVTNEKIRRFRKFENAKKLSLKNLLPNTKTVKKIVQRQ